MRKSVNLGRVLTTLVLTTLVLTAPAQNRKDVLVTIGKNAVTLDEFTRIYERNNSNIQDPENRKTAAEYLELFINFKLKVLEAVNLGMDTARAFTTELEGYRNELSTPYMTNITYNDKLVEDTYQRTLKEINASHIMVELAANAPAEDTLKAWQKIMEIRKEILNGLDFSEAAARYSQDPTAPTNKGELGWFTVFQMVYPFEQAAYSTPVGEISQPVRTRFGYHIVRVNGQRDAEGEIRVAHIMKVYPQNATPEQKETARQAADSLYLMLEKGANFERLARESSDDQRSANNNGEMPWFSRSHMVPEFSNPAFALQKDGDISRPVDSGFGFHIIKRLEYRPVPTFDLVKRELEERIKRDGERSQVSREAFVADLQKEYGFSRNQKAVDELLTLTARWMDGDTLAIPDPLPLQEEIFTFAGRKITPREWALHLRDLPTQQHTKDPLILKRYYHAWEDETLLKYEESRLEEKYPEFRSLLQEYHDGILLFNISEKMIWQKAAADSSGLAAFYQTNKEKYLWPERYRGSVVRCATAAIRENAEKYLESGVTASEIPDLLNLPEGSISISEGTWQQGENPIVDYYIWNGPQPENWDDQKGFIHGGKIAPEPRELDESRGYHISDYQQYLEEEWIGELRKKYPVKVNRKLLKKMTDG